MRATAWIGIGLVLLAWIGWTAFFGQGFSPWQPRMASVVSRTEVASQPAYRDYDIRIELRGGDGPAVRSGRIRVRVTRDLGGLDQPPAYRIGEVVTAYQHPGEPGRLSLVPRGLNLHGLETLLSMPPNGRLLAELAVPGVVALAWLAAIVQRLARRLFARRTRSQGPPRSPGATV